MRRSKEFFIPEEKKASERSKASEFVKKLLRFEFKKPRKEKLKVESKKVKEEKEKEKGTIFDRIRKFLKTAKGKAFVVLLFAAVPWGFKPREIQSEHPLPKEQIKQVLTQEDINELQNIKPDKVTIDKESINLLYGIKNKKEGLQKEVISKQTLNFKETLKFPWGRRDYSNPNYKKGEEEVLQEELNSILGYILQQYKKWLIDPSYSIESFKIRAEVFSSPEGTKKANFKLAEKRAEVLKRLLTKLLAEYKIKNVEIEAIPKGELGDLTEFRKATGCKSEGDCERLIRKIHDGKIKDEKIIQAYIDYVASRRKADLDIQIKTKKVNIYAPKKKIPRSEKAKVFFQELARIRENERENLSDNLEDEFEPDPLRDLRRKVKELEEEIEKEENEFRKGFLKKRRKRLLKKIARIESGEDPEEVYPRESFWSAIYKKGKKAKKREAIPAVKTYKEKGKLRKGPRKKLPREPRGGSRPAVF